MRLSISKVKLFKACRRAYYFKYEEGLIPVEKSESLQIGTSYHELIEWLYSHGDLNGVDQDNSKELAMATAYWKYIYPYIDMTVVEDWSFKQLDGETFVGRVDGISKDGLLVEHKTTSRDIGEEYEFDLQWDEQMLAYMWLTDIHSIYYTMCRKPTIRQKKDESDEEFFQRMVEWYDTDTESKIRYIRVDRTDAEIQECMDEIRDVAAEMLKTENRSLKSGKFYRNTCYCNHWGRRCAYSSICLNYDPNQQYVEFMKEE